MGRRILGLIFLFVFLLAGCQGNEGLRAQLNEKYRTEPFSATVHAEFDHGQQLTRYVLTQTREPDGSHTLTLSEPEALQGLTVYRGPNGNRVTFDGVVFTPPSLEGTTVSPLLLLCSVCDSWATGAALSVTRKNRALTYTVSASVSGETFTYRTRFDTMTLFPVQSECLLDGKRVLTVTYTANP